MARAPLTAGWPRCGGTLDGLGRRLALGLAVGLLGAGAVGCHPRPQAIRLALNDWPGYQYFRLADQKGLIDRSRLKLTILSFRTQADQVRAYVEGRADAVAITSVDAVQICAKAPRRCPVLVFVIDESRGGDRLMAVPRFDSVPLLVGRRIGLEDSALAVYLLHEAFELHGLPGPRPDLLRYGSQEDFAPLLRAGSLDAVLTYPPTASLLQKDLGLRSVFSTRDMPGQILDVLAVDPAQLERGGEGVQALIEGWRSARREEVNAGDTGRRAMAGELGLGIEELLEAQRGVLYPGLQEQWQLLADRGGDHRATLVHIREVLTHIGRIQGNGPLPRLDGRFVFSPPAPRTPR